METDTFLLFIEYKRLVKQAKIWNDTGQYWLGKECERRANAILNENIDEIYKLKIIILLKNFCLSFLKLKILIFIIFLLN